MYVLEPLSSFAGDKFFWKYVVYPKLISENDS